MSIGQRVGIMGGTFNPIHNGHLFLAQSAYEQLQLDKILFIPSGTSYMKKNVLDTKKRVDMVALAIRNYPYFELSLVEAQKSGNSYTCETLEYLKNKHPNTAYYFILGADSLFQIEKWWKPEQIFKLATLVCTVRDDYDLNSIKEKGNSLISTGADIIYLDIPKIDISSTDIRKKVKNGIQITKYVPSAVAEYIHQEHLYYE